MAGMSDPRTCIYLAARPDEVQHVKDVLRRTHITYAVAVSSTAAQRVARFPRYSGVLFYVDPQQSRYGRRELHRAGLVKGMVGTA
jgi:hypothetical protein